jgi:hypothetical protein
MYNMETIIQKYYSGAIRDSELLDAIDNAVQEWHNSGAEISEPLHVFLGMCCPEYALWIKSPSKFVVQMHSQSYFPISWELSD